jgi:hypothetical protein
VGGFFAAGAGKRAAAEAGSTRAVTEREADDLVRDADRFLAVVEQSLGLAAARCPPRAPSRTASRRGPVRADPFVHLHVASGYSLRYGASHPHALVERAAEQEMDTLALTDRDGTYGAVKFAKACLRPGIRPVLGVDLASPRRPAPGGARGRTARPRCAAAPSATRVGGCRG